MKIKLLLVLVFVSFTGFAFAEDTIVEKTPGYSTIVRIEAASIFSGPFSVYSISDYNRVLPNGFNFDLYGANAPQIVVDVVPLLSSTIGIPIVLDIGVYPKTFGLGVMSGIEFTPMKRFSPGGLFARVNVGAYWVPQINFVSLIARADVGWQFISSSGFVVTPGFGVKFNQYSGNSLDIMVDIGGAF